MLPRCIVNGTRVHSRCSTRPSPMHRKTIGDAPWVHRGWYPRPFGMLGLSIADAPEDHREWYQGASPIHPRCIRDALQDHRLCFSVPFAMLSGRAARQRPPGASSLPRVAELVRAELRGANERLTVKAERARPAEPNPTPCMLEREVRTPPAVANFLSAPRAAPVKAREATGVARLAVRGASMVLFLLATVGRSWVGPSFWEPQRGGRASGAFYKVRAGFKPAPSLRRLGGRGDVDHGLARR